VAAWGYWGEVLNPPYAALGLACEEPAFFAVANKQYTRTALDIAQHNVTVGGRAAGPGPCRASCGGLPAALARPALLRVP
jgi:hypothetical protein